MRDYHLHTTLCKHASGEMEEYVEAAIERGITEISFTEHAPLPEGEDPDHRMAPEEVEFYLEQIAILNRKYRDTASKSIMWKALRVILKISSPVITLTWLSCPFI